MVKTAISINQRFIRYYSSCPSAILGSIKTARSFVYYRYFSFAVFITSYVFSLLSFDLQALCVCLFLICFRHIISSTPINRYSSLIRMFVYTPQTNAQVLAWYLRQSKLLVFNVYSLHKYDKFIWYLDTKFSLNAQLI